MNFPFKRERAVTEPRLVPHEAHLMTSAFDAGLCRFVLDCTCGDHLDTPYIDEALEYRELHERLAPLADQLTR